MKKNIFEQKNRKRIYAGVLALVMVMTTILVMLPTTKVNAAIKTKNPLEITFAHGYDVQRSPSFPKKDQQCTVKNFTFPYMSRTFSSAEYNGSYRKQYSFKDTTFTLKSLGLYDPSATYMTKYTLDSKITAQRDVTSSVSGEVSSVARSYGVTAADITLFEMYYTDPEGGGEKWEGYGVLCALDKDGGNAFYCACDGDWGWYLSDTDCSGLSSLTFTVEMDASTGFSYDPDKLNYEVADLGNFTDTSDPNYVPKKRVQGDYNESTNPSASANLHVYLNDEADRITVYKIANMPYSEGEYSGPNWVPNVESWRTTFSSGKYNKPSYASVDSMGSLSNAELASYYADMAAAIGPSISLTAVVTNKGQDNNDSNGYSVNTGLTNLSFGTYLILGVNVSGDSYAPTVVHIAPYKNGPFNNYYIEYDVYAYLKSAAASVNKTLNGHDSSDTVEVGEIVEFDIDVTPPTTPKASIVLTGSTSYASYDFKNIEAYKLQIIDTMSDAFELVKKDGGKVESDTPISDIFEVVATYSKDSAEAKYTIPTGDIEYYEIADAAYISYNTDQLTDKVTAEITRTNNSAYTYDSSNTYFDDKTYYGVKVNAPIYEIVKGSSPSDPTFTVYFNRSALAAKLAANGTDDNDDTPSNITGINIRYKARVTSACEVNSDNNTNHVKLSYAGESSENPVTDTVRAYTYALQILKQDGETGDPLSGAEFKLYKEVYTYSVTLDSNGDVETAQWLGDVFGSASLPTAITTDGDYQVYNPADGGSGDDGLAVFEKDSDYYIYYWTAPVVPVGEDLEANKGEPGGYFITYTKAQDDDEAQIEYLQGSTYARVFKLYKNEFIDTYKDTDSSATSFDGTMTSKDTDEGTILVGLKEGNYIIEETKRPTDEYNALAEDLYFEINRLTDDFAKQYYNSSLITFTDQDGNYDEGLTSTASDGTVTLTVLNFKGLTLPSTGGMGTTLFIILGLIIMGGSFIILVTKRRQFVG